MISKATTVSQYLEELPPDRQAAIGALRTLINKIAPQAAEGMEYGMPVFGDVCALASQKHYMALYCDVGVLDAHRQQLGNLNCGKCCIRFKRLKDLPIKTIESILKQTVKRRKQGIGPVC